MNVKCVCENGGEISVCNVFFWVKIGEDDDDEWEVAIGGKGLESSVVGCMVDINDPEYNSRLFFKLEIII